jgi:hypothetical protein
MIRSERLFSVTPGDLVRRQLPDVLREFLLHGFPLCESRPPLEEAQVVDEELSVEVIDLVLQAAREQVGRFELEWLAVAVERANGDRVARSTSPKISGIERQPSSPLADPP